MRRILQKALFKPTQDVQLTDDDFIAITIRRILSERSFRLDLREFDPESSRQKAFSQKPVALCILLGLFFLTGAIPALTEEDPIQRGPYIVSAIFWAVLLLGSAAYAWFTRADLLVYFHRYSGKAHLSLYHNNPDAACFASFVAALEARLRALNPRSTPFDATGKRGHEHPFLLN